MAFGFNLFIPFSVSRVRRVGARETAGPCPRIPIRIVDIELVPRIQGVPAEGVGQRPASVEKFIASARHVVEPWEHYRSLVGDASPLFRISDDELIAPACA